MHPLIPRLLALGAIVAGCAGTPGGIHARMGWSEQGLRIVEVPRRGPGYSAGLRPGDRLLSIDGHPVRRMSMKEAVEQLRGDAGTPVKLEIQRGDEILELEVRRAPYR